MVDAWWWWWWWRVVYRVVYKMGTHELHSRSRTCTCHVCVRWKRWKIWLSWFVQLLIRCVLISQATLTAKHWLQQQTQRSGWIWDMKEKRNPQTDISTVQCSWEEKSWCLGAETTEIVRFKTCLCNPSDFVFGTCCQLRSWWGSCWNWNWEILQECPEFARFINHMMMMILVHSREGFVELWLTFSCRSGTTLRVMSNW